MPCRQGQATCQGLKPGARPAEEQASAAPTARRCSTSRPAEVLVKIHTLLTPARALACCLFVLAVLLLQLRGTGGTEAPAGQGATPPSKRVTLLSSFSLQDSARYQEAFAAMERSTGIEVVIRAAGGDFADHVFVATPGFEAPDIAVFAQPGLFREMVAGGFIHPLPPDLAQTVVRDFPPFLDPLLRRGDQHYGLWARVAIKSLVWYRRALFEQHGLAVPRSDAELAALEQQMIRKGLVPWCIGVAARGATGWVGTDWVEEFMLRDAGPAAYDRWVAQELPFTAGPVRRAFARWDRMVRTPGMTLGGPEGVLHTFVEEAARKFAGQPAPCMMMRNSEWVTSEFPDSVHIGPGEQIDFFILPGRSESHVELLVAGDVAAPLNARPETMEVLRYMASADFGRRRAAAGAYLSGHKDVEPASYVEPLAARLSAVWHEATVMRMDASDLMPAVLGTAAFWTGMVDHLKGASVNDVTAGIDRTWRQWRAQQAAPAAAAPASAAASR